MSELMFLQVNFNILVIECLLSFYSLFGSECTKSLFAWKDTINHNTLNKYRNLTVDSLSLILEHQRLWKPQVNTNILCLKLNSYSFLSTLVKH